MKSRAHDPCHKTAVQSYRNQVSKAKARLKLKLWNNVKGNNKGVYEYINNHMLTRENLHLLLNEQWSWWQRTWNMLRCSIPSPHSLLIRPISCSGCCSWRRWGQTWSTVSSRGSLVQDRHGYIGETAAKCHKKN